MDKYEAIRSRIEQARIERSVYLAELLADAIVTGWNAIKATSARMTDVSKVKPILRHNVFTFDA